MSESQPDRSASDPSPESVASTRDAEQQTRIAASPFELSQEPVTPAGPPAPAGTVPAPAYEHLGELPANYGTQSVYLVAYDPRQLFAYWDVDWAAAGNAGPRIACLPSRRRGGRRGCHFPPPRPGGTCPSDGPAAPITWNWAGAGAMAAGSRWPIRAGS